MSHNTSIDLFPRYWLLIPTLIKALLINQSGNYVSLHAAVRGCKEVDYGFGECHLKDELEFN